MITSRALRVFVPLLLLAAGCTDPAKIRPHATLTPGAEPLRSQFNSDAGKVRILMIVAPT